MAPTPSSTSYVTKPGDSAQTLAKSYNTTADAIKAANPNGQFQGSGQDFWGPNVTLNIPGQQPVSPPQSQIINTSSKSRTTFAKNTSDLSGALAKLNGNPTGENPNPAPDKNDSASILNNTNDPIISGLNQLSSNADAATKSLIASTQATYQNKINTVNKQYDNYKKGLELLGIQHNDAQATPDLLAGHIQQAANDQMDKINALTAEESKALIDAKSAKDTNDFKTLQAKMDYVKQVQSQKAQSIKDMYDTIASADKTAAIEAHDIFDTMDTLDDADKESFILAVAKKYNLPVNSLVQALADEKNTREKDSVDLQNKKRIASGGGGTGGTFKTSTGISQLTPVMEENKGEDGYIDPYKWVEARTTWQQQGGTAASFKSNFIQYLNPESYKVAGYTTPKSAKRTL